MNFSHFNSIAGSLLILLALTSPLSAATDRYRVVWEQNPESTAIIGWNQINGKNPIVYYGPVDHGQNIEKYPHQTKATRREQYMGMDNRFATLSNLKPNTPCYFVIADDDSKSPRHWFLTAPDTPQSFTFIGGGDTKSDPDGRARGRNGNLMVSKLRPLFVCYAGDFTTNGLKAHEWKNWLADWSEDTTSEDGRVYPIVPVRGNHEPHPDILYRLFGLSDPKNYFAMNIGANLLRLYALNSEINVDPNIKSKRGDNQSPAAKAQTKWLINDLKANKNKKFKIAAYHKPLRPHTESKSENDYLYAAWSKPFHQHRLTAALEGDSHLHKITYPVRPASGPGHHQGFIRDDKNGTVFLGEGSWGAATRPDNDDKPWTLDSAQITQIKWFHVHPNRIELRTVLTENVAEIAAVTDEAPFSSPQNLELHEAPRYGKVLRLPFTLNQWNEQKLTFQNSQDLPPPSEVLPYKNIGDETLRMHLFYPPDKTTPEPLPVAVMFFGGGWVNGTPAHFYAQARHLADQGIIAACPEYRINSLHGTTPFDAVRDAKSAVRWLRQYAETFSIDPNKVIAIGGSAGGHLAASTALIKAFNEPHEDSSVSAIPNALVLFNPVLDTTEKGYGVEKVAPNGVGEPTILSPIHHIRKNMPPTLIFHGTADSIVPFENAERFQRLMRKAGNHCALIPYEDQDHGFFNRANGSPKFYIDTVNRMTNFLHDLGYLSKKSW
ncbi:MAG: alpha/beta hydrolase fold domain-containing protein [Verrucomicrobiota bacterium]